MSMVDSDSDSLASLFLGSIWITSTLLALLPKKRISLSDSKRTDPHQTDLSRNPRDLKERLKGEIIQEENFKHEISKARILLSFFGLTLSVSRIFQLGYEYHYHKTTNLHRMEISDALVWINFFLLSYKLPKSLFFGRCLHLFLLSSCSLLFQLSLLVTPMNASSSNFSSFNVIRISSDRGSIFIVTYLSNSFFVLLTMASMLVSSRIPLGPKRALSTNPGSIPAKEVTNLSLRDGASIFDRIFFNYCLGIVSKVKNKGRLTSQDVPLLDSSLRAELLGHEFESNLGIEKSKLEKKQREGKSETKDSQSSPWPVFWSMVKSNAVGFGFMTFSGPLVAASFYAPALCLNRIVKFLEENELDPDPNHHTSMYRFQHGFRYCFLLGLVTLVGGSLQNTFFAYGGELVVRIKTQLNTSIFSKTLRKKDISSESNSSVVSEGDDSISEGEGASEEGEESFKSKAQVIQLSSVDTTRVSEFSEHYFAFILFPFELMIGGSFIYSILGNSALVGIAVSVITAPLTSFIAGKQSEIQKKLQVSRDKRVSILNETFAAIRMIKFAAWENQVQEKILKLRGMELFYQRLSFMVDVALDALFVFTPNLSILVTFAWFVFVQKETLKPSVAFSGISVLLELRYLLSFVPELIASIVTSWVSTRRIAQYLGSEELEFSESTTDGVVAIRSATIGWPIERNDINATSGTSTPAAGPFKLRDINVEFHQGTLNLITGRLGTGKTLLLLALLHEAEISSGHVQSPRSSPDAIKGDKGEIIPPSEWIRSDLVAYTPQSAFLTNATIKENILFGLPLDESRYQETVAACQLNADLDQLEDGDETEIGENGIGLSGGQKTRVSIARSFYSRASTLLLDDVLAAVDASTASRLVSDLLVGPLAQGRTIILVSHQVHLCGPIASKVVLLNDEGRIGFDGSADSFLKSESYFGLYDEEPTNGSKLKEADPKGSGSEAAALAEDEAEILKTQEDQANSKKDKTSPKKLVKDEKLEEGSIKLSVYLTYIREGGWELWVCTAIVFIAVNSWPALTAAWLRNWSMDAIAVHRHHVDLWYFTRLAVLYAIEVGLSVISLLLLFSASLRASSKFFKLVLKSVFGATLRFHDTVSRGRLLNRFGSDFESLDEELASMLKDLIGVTLDLLVHLAVVMFTNGLSFVILFALILPTLVYVGLGFSAATRDLRRIESASRSPVMSAFSDLVSGVTVTRAFGCQSHSLNVLTQRSDNSTQSTWFRLMMSRWLCFFFQLSSSVLALFASLFILTKPGMTAATAGFALSFLINIFTRLAIGTMRFSDVQQRLVSVERIVEFATELDSEPASVLEPPPENWPQGDIVAQDLSLRYSPELPDVLKNVNFSIKKGQKVALVGSTGSGKTSLATALFRFTDPSAGKILIDGIDITRVGLRDLRSRMQIIPQDPTILSGPLRDSIDVFNEHTDAEVVSALKAVQLIGSSTSPSAAVSIHEGQAQDIEENNSNVFRDLSYPIAEGGSNLSNGQRQLICLARALLKKASIIVFDEATSSIDNETEEILSATIREAFADATVLTIAHRLRTIANYDLVMVMDKGSIIEMETPAELLTRPDSKFYTLCQAAGKAEFEHLKKLAGL